MLFIFTYPYIPIDIYFSPPSGDNAKTFFPFPNFFAISKATKIAAPEEIPTNIPSSLENLMAVFIASSSLTGTTLSTYSAL